jgi:hypothetical protein
MSILAIVIMASNAHSAIGKNALIKHRCARSEPLPPATRQQLIRLSKPTTSRDAQSTPPLRLDD